MQLTINTTPLHDAALTDINKASNPVNPPKLEDFTTQLILGKLDDEVVSNQESKLDTRMQELRQSVSKLTDADYAAIQQVIDKYAGK